MHDFDTQLFCRRCKRSAKVAYLRGQRAGLLDQCLGRDLFVFHWDQKLGEES